MIFFKSINLFTLKFKFKLKGSDINDTNCHQIFIVS